MSLLEQIPSITLIHIPQSFNSKADALAKLAKELSNPEEDPIFVFVQQKQILSPICVDNNPYQQISIIKEQEDNWRQVFIEYLRHENFLSTRLWPFKSKREFSLIH